MTDFIAEALRRVPGFRKTCCIICKEETLYAAHCAIHGGGIAPRCLVKREAPKTCGRLPCMIRTGEMLPVA